VTSLHAMHLVLRKETSESDNFVQEVQVISYKTSTISGLRHNLLIRLFCGLQKLKQNWDCCLVNKLM
jgi:hypothetical protein